MATWSGRSPGSGAGKISTLTLGPSALQPPAQSSQNLTRSASPRASTSAWRVFRIAAASRRIACPPRSTGSLTTPGARGHTVTTSRRARVIVERAARPAHSVGGLPKVLGASSRQPGGEPERGANRGRGGGAPARAHALTRDGADQAGPEPVVLEDAPGPAHVDRRSKRQGAHGVADVFGEPRLARAGDPARGAVAAAGPREDAWGEGGNPAHRVGRVDKAQDRGEITSRRQRAEPLTAKPEPRTLVADQRAEAARSGPAAAPIVGDHDRAGSREHEGARPVADRAEERRLGVRDHLDAQREAAERVGQGAALAPGPERARGDDESGNIATAPAPALPDRPEQPRELCQIPVSGRNDGPDAAVATRGCHAHPCAPDVHTYAERKRGLWFSIPVNPFHEIRWFPVLSGPGYRPMIGRRDDGSRVEVPTELPLCPFWCPAARVGSVYKSDIAQFFGCLELARPVLNHRGRQSHG